MPEKNSSTLKAQNIAARRQLPLCMLIHKAASARLSMVQQKRTFAETLETVGEDLHSHERAALKSILYLCERTRARSQALTRMLVARPPKPQVQALLETALSLVYSDAYPQFTVVSQAVEAARLDRRTERFAGLVNAVLRRAIREKDALFSQLATNLEVIFNAPLWWIERVKDAYPDDWRSILELAAQKPPLTLRVNRRRSTPEDYLTVLRNAGIAARRIGPEAILLEKPRPVENIPGFGMGLVSVQDAGTQMAAHLLAPQPGAEVLDACAAPGGKTAHLLELFDCNVTALEIDPKRIKLIEATLKRLGLQADVRCADAANLAAWWQGQCFDAILLDAPCTASGIVRRQPDIPWTRRPEDPMTLAKTQARLLNALWPLVKPGGKLLFCTCSIFPEEGTEQIKAFLKQTPDAKALPIGRNQSLMMTLIPLEEIGSYDEDEKSMKDTVDEPAVHDGFFYALLQKTV